MDGRRYEEGETRAAEIVSAARSLFEEKGLARTSIGDITSRVGVTRSLFYHYFPDKDSVTVAVMDDVVADFVGLVREWDRSRTKDDVVGAVLSCVRMLRRGLTVDDPFRRELADTDNAALYLQFSSRVAETLSHELVSTTAAEYRRYHPIEIRHLDEMFYLLITGLIGLVRRHPETDDEVLADLIIQTLHLDVGDAWPPATDPDGTTQGMA